MPEQHHVPEHVERALQDLKDMHLTPPLVDRFVGFWKRHGPRKAAVLLLAVTLPLWRYVWIPHALSGGLSAIAEAYGAELDVEDWNSDWGNIRVVGEGVVLHARGAYTNQKLLEAGAIELDWSLWRGAGNLFNRARSLILFRTPPAEEPVQMIKLRRATLHMERLLSGRWNWQDAIEAERVNWNRLTLFRIPALDAEELRIAWVEHLPANSGGGLIEQTTASLFLEDVRLRFTDLMLPHDARANAASFTIDGRTADGRFSATGHLNLARWAAADNGVRKVSTNGGQAWTPTFDVSMYLENVGFAAISRLVADASLLPTAGTITGRIQLVGHEDGKLNCTIDVQLRNVQYTPNPRSTYVQARQSAVTRELATFVANEHVQHECAADWQDPDFRVAKALQAEITGGAVQNAPPAVQAAAGYDRLRFVEADQAAVDKFTSDMTTTLGAALGGQTGAAVAQVLTAPAANGQTTAAGNPVSRGLSKVSRGFKRVFGGSDTKKKK